MSRYWLHSKKTTKHQFAFQLDAVASRPCLALPYRQWVHYSHSSSQQSGGCTTALLLLLRFSGSLYISKDEEKRKKEKRHNQFKWRKGEERLLAPHPTTGTAQRIESCTFSNSLSVAVVVAAAAAVVWWTSHNLFLGLRAYPNAPVKLLGIRSYLQRLGSTSNGLVLFFFYFILKFFKKKTPCSSSDIRFLWRLE